MGNTRIVGRLDLSSLSGVRLCLVAHRHPTRTRQVTRPETRLGHCLHMGGAASPRAHKHLTLASSHHGQETTNNMYSRGKDYLLSR